MYVTHDLAVVTWPTGSLSMYSGQFVEEGPVSRNFLDAHPYTQSLLAAVPSPDHPQFLSGIKGRPPRPAEIPPGCSFIDRCNYAVPACSQAHLPRAEFDGGSRSVLCIRALEVENAHEADDKHTDRVTSMAHLMRQDSDVILSVNNLTARYNQLDVLHGISFDIAKNECLAIVGESGSGKTTLARCIAGMHSKWSGVVTLDSRQLGHGVSDRSRESLKSLQYVFQNPYGSLNPRQTIGQIVSEPLSHFFELSRADQNERVSAALDEVSLGSSFFHRYPDRICLGGERQRVAIARALAAEPDLLICDEVTSALDVSVQATIIELLRQLQVDRHSVMIFITHSLGLVQSIASSVVVLADGMVVDAGCTSDVLKHPTSSYTVALLKDVPRMCSDTV